ncbi:MAG: DUF262 domain-containing protein [Dehalococcoidia bacterium]|nr:MAG: DUF262 domain-containing protein [Dehalococcoidia bacterium]
MVEKIEALEVETFREDDSFELPPPDIIAYNELRSCADLFRMYTQGILEIKPEYQREIVWKDAEQTRFIDSLVKQLPIPSMCFSLDYKTQKWQIIDGLQRMWSIIRFLSDTDWILSKLDDIDPKMSGQPVSRLVDRNSDLHSYFTRVENLTLPITILRCDYSKPSHTNYIFVIFHRLNSGGARLNNQEIRNCIYGGSLNELLKELNKNPNWMKINKMKQPSGYRFIQEEIILRFFTLHDGYKDYAGRLAKFLNNYMSEHRNPGDSFLTRKRNLFNRTVDIVYKSIFEGKPPRKLSISVLEAILVGVSFNLEFVEKQTTARIQAMYNKLLGEEEFSDKKLREGLSGKERVIGRMSTAKRVFSGQ